MFTSHHSNKKLGKQTSMPKTMPTNWALGKRYTMYMQGSRCSCNSP